MNERETNRVGRLAIEHFRNSLELSNRALAEAFQVSPDHLQDFLDGDDEALTQAQKTYIGLELGHLATAEDEARESMPVVYDPQSGHYVKQPTPPGVREVLGITK